MRRHTGCLLILVASSMACSQANLGKAPFLTPGKFVEAQSNELNETSEPQAATSNDAAATAPVPMPQQPPLTQEEKVSPPGNISGSYLICAESKAATDSSPESIINCGLRDQKTNAKINISASYVSKLWSYQTNTSTSVAMMISELTASLEWHISISIKASNAAEVQAGRDSMKFYVTVQDAAGKKYQEVATVGPMFLQWMALNGGTVPSTAAIGGTEDDGRENLFLCRIYMGAEVIPGKMIVHFNDSKKSICYSSFNNSAIQSHADDPAVMIYKSDVLRITDGVFDDYYEWLPSSNGLKPANAVTTGIDTLGNPLYSCRNLQSDGSIQEQTPGVLRPGASTCAHEFYGVKTNSNYQVLSWKAAAMQKILAPRQPVP